MPQVLLLDDDVDTVRQLRGVLERDGYRSLTAMTGSEGLRSLTQGDVDVVVMGSRLPDTSGVEMLRALRADGSSVPVIVMSAVCRVAEVVTAMRLGAVDFLQKPVAPTELLHAVALAVTLQPHDAPAPLEGAGIPAREAHAAARWARALVPIIDSPIDVRTLARWGQWVSLSASAIRNRCRTARISARRSLVFGRMLRAVHLSRGGGERPENLLDVADLRTLAKLLSLAGFQHAQALPGDMQEFLERQVLVRDPAVLGEIRRALDRRANGRTPAARAGQQVRSWTAVAGREPRFEGTRAGESSN